ncbi:unnamed protein product [Lampetra fluviatilis]
MMGGGKFRSGAVRVEQQRAQRHGPVPGFDLPTSSRSTLNCILCRCGYLIRKRKIKKCERHSLPGGSVATAVIQNRHADNKGNDATATIRYSDTAAAAAATTPGAAIGPGRLAK